MEMKYKPFFFKVNSTMDYVNRCRHILIKILNFEAVKRLTCIRKNNYV